MKEFELRDLVSQMKLRRLARDWSKMHLRTTVMIAIAEIKESLSEDMNIKEKLEKAMALAVDHWLVTQEIDRFNSAIGAVLLVASSEEREIILREIQLLNAISSNLPIDWDELLSEKSIKLYGLLPLWKKIKENKRIKRR